MKFIIERASRPFDTIEEPCKEAKREKLVTYDTMNFKSFEEYQEKLHESFLAEGFDHKVTEKGIVRSLMREYWTIDINSLEELNSFIDTYGDIIIEDIDTDYRCIVIYDDYIE